MENIQMQRGRTQTFNINVTDGNGDAYTLKTGEKLIFGVKKNYFDADYLIKKTITSENAQTGGYLFKITPEDTENMSCDTYCYDIGLQSGDDYFSVTECSKFILTHNVTRKEETP